MTCTLYWHDKPRGTFAACSTPGFHQQMLTTKDGHQPSGLLIPKPLTLTDGSIPDAEFRAWLNTTTRGGGAHRADQPVRGDRPEPAGERRVGPGGPTMTTAIGEKP